MPPFQSEGLLTRGTNHMVRGLELLVPPHPHHFLESRKGFQLKQSPTVSDLINCACVMNPP